VLINLIPMNKFAARMIGLIRHQIPPSRQAVLRVL
jgi:hypothetical protein